MSEAFFARQLSLENYEAANFAGLAETFFRQNKTEKALQILRLAIAASDEETSENALREIASIDEIKARAADTAKAENSGSVNFNKTFAINFAAETAVKFGQKNVRHRTSPRTFTTCARRRRKQNETCRNFDFRK